MWHILEVRWGDDLMVYWKGLTMDSGQRTVRYLVCFSQRGRCSGDEINPDSTGTSTLHLFPRVNRQRMNHISTISTKTAQMGQRAYFLVLCQLYIHGSTIVFQVHELNSSMYRWLLFCALHLRHIVNGYGSVWSELLVLICRARRCSPSIICLRWWGPVESCKPISTEVLMSLKDATVHRGSPE